MEFSEEEFDDLVDEVRRLVEKSYGLGSGVTFMIIMLIFSELLKDSYETADEALRAAEVAFWHIRKDIRTSQRFTSSSA